MLFPGTGSPESFFKTAGAVPVVDRQLNRRTPFVVTVAIMTVSCSKVLDEQPRTFFEPGFFQTEAGVEGGLTALYASLRYFYGQAYYYNINTTGTDEATYGQSADGNFKDADLSGVGSLTSSSSRSDVLWNTVFPYINTANGIIENAEAVGLSSALIAEAKFFRAWYYFQLVQTFGGVPLDLGSGELAFNSSPVRVSTRNTVPEVYNAIFGDLTTAVAELPENPRVVGGVTKTVARLVLAVARQHIDRTYPVPDGHRAVLVPSVVFLNTVVQTDGHVLHEEIAVFHLQLHITAIIAAIACTGDAF